MALSGGVHGGGSWARLAANPGDDLGGATTTVILEILTLGEPTEGWVTLDTVFLTELGVDRGIDLHKLHVGQIRQCFGSLDIFGSEGLAVATPWSV